MGRGDSQCCLSFTIAEYTDHIQTLVKAVTADHITTFHYILMIMQAIIMHTDKHPFHMQQKLHTSST